MIDPVALPDLSPLDEALRGTEWVLHAASQDLPGLAEQGISPDAVFDTELAARLLRMERVGLAAVVAELLGLGLAKEHSAVDWSTRPLPADWVRYAALDVEVLVEVRDLLAARLRAAGKEEWARQEFEAVRTAPPAPPRVEPWRRTSGTARGAQPPRPGRGPRPLADPGRRCPRPGHLPRAGLARRRIVAAGVALPRTVAELVELKQFSGKATRRRAPYWFEAVTARPGAARGGAAVGARSAVRRPAAPTGVGGPRPCRSRASGGGPRRRRRLGAELEVPSRTCCSRTSCAGCAGRLPRPSTPPPSARFLPAGRPRGRSSSPPRRSRRPLLPSS